MLLPPELSENTPPDELMLALHCFDHRAKYLYKHVFQEYAPALLNKDWKERSKLTVSMTG